MLLRNTVRLEIMKEYCGNLLAIFGSQKHKHKQIASELHHLIPSLLFFVFYVKD
jgi:hypothetical protein